MSLKYTLFLGCDQTKVEYTRKQIYGVSYFIRMLFILKYALKTQILLFKFLTISSDLNFPFSRFLDMQSTLPFWPF